MALFTEKSIRATYIQGTCTICRGGCFADLRPKVKDPRFTVKVNRAKSTVLGDPNI